MLLSLAGTEAFDRKTRKSHDRMVKRAHDLALAHTIELDYRDKNLTVVDDLLCSIAKELHDSGVVTSRQIINNRTAREVTECLGHYLVECIERNHTAGLWRETDPDGELTSCFQLLDDNSVVFPMEWVMEKLLDPKHYSVDEAYAQYVG